MTTALADLPPIGLGPAGGVGPATALNYTSTVSSPFGTSSDVDLSSVCDYIRENFFIFWACDDCSLEIRLKGRTVTKLRGHKLPDGSTHGDVGCLQDVLLVKSTSDDDKWHSKIRNLSKTFATNCAIKEISMCQRLLDNKNCEDGDNCLAAHSPEEQTIWGLLLSCSKENSFNVFVQTLKKSSFAQPATRQNPRNYNLQKSHSTQEEKPEHQEIFAHKSRKYYPMSLSQMTSGLMDSHVNQPDVSSVSEHALNFDYAHSVHSNPTRKIVTTVGTKNNFDTQSTHSNASSQSEHKFLLPQVNCQRKSMQGLDLYKTVPLTTSYDFCLACHVCHNPSTKSVQFPPQISPHKCPMDFVLSRDKANSAEQCHWERVRSHQTLGTKACRMCPYFLRTCPNGNKCPSAHSQLEEFLWKNELQTGAILLPQNILECLKKCTLINNEPSVIREYQSLGKFRLFFGCIECVTSVGVGYYTVKLFAHACTHSMAMFRKLNEPTNFWRFVRPWAHQGLSICRHLNTPTGCWLLDECKFATCDEELEFWKQQARGLINVKLFLQQELQHWLEKMPQITAPPTKTTQLGLASLVPKIQPGNCPFPVHVICGSCYSNDKKICYKKSRLDVECPRAHDWRSSKTVAAILSPKEAVPIRPLPKHLLNGNFDIKICNHVASGQKCVRPECFFAHNNAEQRVWSYLLKFKPGQNIDDIVTAPVLSGPGASCKMTIPKIDSKKPVWSLDKSPVLPTQSVTDEAGMQFCFLCDCMFQDGVSYKVHCTTVEHQQLAKVDSTQSWAHRPPCTSRPFSFCEKHDNGRSCPYSSSCRNACPYAHSYEELWEWNRRVELAHRQLLKKQT